MTMTPYSDKDFNLWALLIQTRDAIFKARDHELSQYGITVVEARALFIIQAIEDKATPSKISKWMLRRHHTVSALLKRMESKGLIMKTKDPDRKNTWIVSITEKGQNAFQNSNIRESLHEIMSVLSEDEHTKLESSMKKLRDQAIRHTVDIPSLPFP